MNDQPTVPSQPASPIQPPKKSSGCLRIFLWAAGFALFIFIIIAILIWQSVNWLKNAPESRIATYPALTLSPGEEEDVNRVIASIEQAKQRDALYEEYITPNVFNAVMAKIVDSERRKGKKDAPLYFRVAMAGSDQVEIKVTVPEQHGQTAADGSALHVNAEIVFRLEIVDGEFRQASVDKLVLRGREAPFLSRVVVNYLVAGMKAASQQEKNKKENKLAAIKLLKRDGDRIHFILDGKIMRLQEQQDQEQKPPANPQTEKPGTF